MNATRGRVLPIVLLLVAAGATVGVLLSRPGIRGGAIQPKPSLVEQSSTEPDNAGARDPAIVAKLGEEHTAREFLASYWGAAWSDIEREMLEQGLDLDEAYVFRPWEDVSAEFRSLFEFPAEKVESRREQKIGWPLILTPEWVLQRFPIASRGDRVLGDREVAEIEDLTSEIHSRLYERFDEWGNSMARALESTWQRGTFVKAPFSTYGVPRAQQGRAFYAGARSGSGWSVRVQLYSEEFPEIEALMREMAGMRRERDLLVVNYLKEL